MCELTEVLIRSIIYAMENQEETQVLDTATGVMVALESLPREERPDPADVELDPGGRFQPPPPWGSAEGYRLMEQFLLELHNPVARQTLEEILHSGQRVFRRFKDTLREYPDVEKRYHRFKYLHMRTVVIQWYNTLRELNGLDAREIGADEELDGLVLSDVTIRLMERCPAQLITEWDEQAYLEAHARLPDALRRHLYRRRRKRYLPPPSDPSSVIYGAWDPRDELCGFVWAVRERMAGSEAMLEFHQLTVRPEYRGLGIARTLLETCLRDARAEGIHIFIARLPGMGPAAVALMRDTGFSLIREDYLLID